MTLGGPSKIIDDVNWRTDKQRVESKAAAPGNQPVIVAGILIYI